ncbi:MAG: amidase [SAR324 cluster bacterium]|nr:amidase [SAR324 cluster bacterium]
MSAAGTELTHLSLVEAAQAIAAGKTSSEEVTRACLERIEQLQPRLNCFIAIRGDEALDDARRADQEQAKGNLRGPLHGVPLAHKDLYYRAGTVSTGGTIIRKDFVPDYTATVLERLGAAGALDLGALNMCEFATGPHGLNDHYGHCRNPWNIAHICGGSSSGSGTSVAGRLVFGSLGTDTGGSVRLPAGMCGLVGLKPTYSRVSRHGVMPLSFSLDHVGPLTRTVRDCARMMTVIAGQDSKDPTSSAEPVPDYEAGLEEGVKGLKIGVPENYFYDKTGDEVRKAMEQSLEVYRSLGAELVTLQVPDMAQVFELGQIVSRAEAAALHRQWLAERPGDYSPQVRARNQQGLMIPATHYIEALSLRQQIMAGFVAEVLDKVDVLHTPMLSIPVPTIEETDVGASERMNSVITGLTWCTRPFNYLGVPVLTMPAGLSANGLPMSFQLAGRPYGEAKLLRIARAYEKETGWHETVPPC